MLIQDQFGIIHNLQTSPISQTSFLVGTFFAGSYSKTALVVNWLLMMDSFLTPAKKLTHLVGAKTGNPKNFSSICHLHG